MGGASTLTETARALREGRVTSVGLTEAALAEAERSDGSLGVYLTRFDERARAAAARADEELARGIDRGPLHGIPFGVKDTIAAAEGPTTAQSLVHDRRWWAGRDAPVVARLRAAGAVLTGKTTAMEFGCGLPQEDKPFPFPRNPWRTESWAGGSSSGSASGIAAGMFAAALGSDTGGSIRMPAAFCGVTGLMPTFGRVPAAGCVPLGHSLDRVGPLARSARDCSAVLNVIAAPPGGVRAASGCLEVPFTEPPFGGDLAGMRVGVVREHHFPEGGDPALPGAFDEAVSVFTGLGADAVEVRLPYWKELITTAFVTAACEGLAHHRTDLSRRWDDYCVASRGLLATGALMSGADYVQAQRVRTVAQRAVDVLFADVDVVVCPTASIGAPPFGALADAAGHQDHAGVFGKIHTPYWNPLANPVLAVPMGVTAAALPLSLQIAGPVAGEATILRVGDAFQRYTDWHLRTPVPVTYAADATGADRTSVAPIRPDETTAHHDVGVRVRTLLSAARLPADEGQIAGLVSAYAAQRPAVDALHEMPEARCAAPVLHPDVLVPPHDHGELG
ncbi:putative Glutamyl-tRNA(Gln) amidotransferase subunit A [Streptomyces aurantiacus JA 4570]|uniref:Putative Glutamyl-tRNA(Gln) amidotransferase subunit A n=1 Tax=Streptomyces aurantiacus JA 4570 TaxID=1286094 RepID=S3ZFE9_9ACTN|nr:putative Glutamyl-tRNA(Gln) amidotransferase subunit A [Streptomyces aurantiacus JA 4570]